MKQLWQRLTGGGQDRDGVGSERGTVEVTDEDRRKDMLSCFEKYSKVGGFRTAVEHISSRELAMLPKDAYVLVDCRPERERQVSRIPGSISQQEFEAKTKEVFMSDNNNNNKKLVVTSCTIGYRSGKFAKQLVDRAKKEAKSNAKSKGHSPPSSGLSGLLVKNHRGSLMDWCHEGYSLVDPQGKETRNVHPYGKNWVKYFPHQKGYQFVL